MRRSLTTPSGGNLTLATVYRLNEEQDWYSYSTVTLSLCARLGCLLSGGTTQARTVVTLLLGDYAF